LQSIPYNGDDSHTFARALLSFAKGMGQDFPVAHFKLPRFRLSVTSDSGDYLEMCRRALVNEPSFAPDLDLNLAVLDYETHPELPRGRWASEMFGLAMLAGGLKSSGLEGSLNVDESFLQFYDPATGSGIEALVRPGQFPPWVASFPLRNFFHWAYQGIGWRIIHAGTLAIDGQGVMLVGKGGSGKSGTTLAGIVAGLDSAGDDYLAVENGDEGVYAYPVMKLMKQDTRGLERLGLDPVAPVVGPLNWQSKHEFDFEDLGCGRRASKVDLRAILLPRIADAPRTVISPAPSRTAMMEMAPNNLQQLPDGWRKGLAFTATIARRLPAFHLDLSNDPHEIAGTIADFIEGALP
jgi:hypothetical protein